MKKYLFAVSVIIGAVTCGAAPLYSVYPVPQSLVAGDAIVSLTPTVNIVAEPGVARSTVGRAREVFVNAGFEVTESNELTDGTDLLLGSNGSAGVADGYATSHGVTRSVFDAAQHRFDNHIVALDADGDFLVLGNGEGSEFYGLATIEQILEQRNDDNALTTFTIEDYSYVKYRGAVEGFYGHPFSCESRLDIFDYFKRYKLNYYLYAPKSDPYHTGRWREAYPDQISDEQRNLGQFTADDMRTMAAKARECNIQLVWACHPALQGNAISFSNLEAGVADIMTKFDMMYQLGFRSFGVSVDDISGHPSSQWRLGDMVQTAIDEKYNTGDVEAADRVGHLIFVPSQYALNYGTYTLGAFANANPNLEVAFTGYDCFSNLRAGSFDTMAGLIGRDPVFWWNNPVNDDYDEFLYMHGLGARWSIEQTTPVEHMRGILLNPMNQGQASKICFFNGADYGWNPAAYDERSSWEQAVRSIAVTDEYAEALMQFIECMSAYVTHDTKTPEGEAYAALYEECRQGVAAGRLSGYDELREKMDRTRRACDVLRGMATSQRPDHRLFFCDIEPWLNKIQEQADIVVRSLDILSGNTSAESWTDVVTLLPRVNAIATDGRFRHSVLEGAGTNTYEKSMMVQPTPKYMDSFAAFIATEASKCQVSLPERCRVPEIITNGATVPNVELTSADDLVELLIHEGVELEVGEYIGVNLNAIYSTVPECGSWLPEGVELQQSVNGKLWVPADNSEASEFVFVRFKNISEDAVCLGETVLNIELPAVEDSKVESVLTNMSAYNSYVVENVADGDRNTFFWKNNAQKEGDYITLDYGRVGRRAECRLWFTASDRPTGTLAVQSSVDNADWRTHATFTSDDIDSEGKFACSLDDVQARYVRIYFQSVGSNYWFQLSEFEVDGFSTGWMPAAIDNDSTRIAVLDDRDLSTSYTPRGEGWIEYRFTENVGMQRVDIYHISEFKPEGDLPSLKVMAEDGEWQDFGALYEACTSLDMSECLCPVALRIEWNDVNIPRIYEIYAQGPLYVEPKPDLVRIAPADAVAPLLVLRAEAGVLYVESSRLIDTVRIYDLAGRLCASEIVEGSRAAVLSRAVHGVIEVTLSDGSLHTTKF